MDLGDGATRPGETPRRGTGRLGDSRRALHGDVRAVRTAAARGALGMGRGGARWPGRIGDVSVRAHVPRVLRDGGGVREMRERRAGRVGVARAGRETRVRRGQRGASRALRGEMNTLRRLRTNRVVSRHVFFRARLRASESLPVCSNGGVLRGEFRSNGGIRRRRRRQRRRRLRIGPHVLHLLRAASQLVHLRAKQRHVVLVRPKGRSQRRLRSRQRVRQSSLELGEFS